MMAVSTVGAIVVAVAKAAPPVITPAVPRAMPVPKEASDAMVPIFSVLVDPALNAVVTMT
jgi:hypothetical protein